MKGISERKRAWPVLLALVCPMGGAAIAGTPAKNSPRVLVVGRIEASQDGWRATWPGTMLTVRFEGRAVGVGLDDGQSGYIAEIDNGAARNIDAMPGVRTVWLRNLTEGPHILRLIRRNETPEMPGLVKRFLIEKGKWLPAPVPAKRQIEFIGDSWTAAFGNMSKERECSPEQIRDRTDASRSFGMQVARHYGADWQLRAYPGRE